jgi:hypothetical protein
MPRLRERADFFIQPIRIAPPELRASGNTQQRKVTKRGLANIGESGEGRNFG